MNTNGTNQGMNIEDYEDLAVRKSNVAKKVAIGAAGVAGAAALAGGSAYAASNMNNNDDVIEDPLTTEDMTQGAEVGEEFQPVEESTQETLQQTTQYVYVEKPAAPEPVQNDEPEVTWDESTQYKVNGETLMTVESGTVGGHKFTLMDADGDDHADVLAIDMNDNGKYEDSEIEYYSPKDHVHMGHETAHTREVNYGGIGGQGSETYREYAYNNNSAKGRDVIHNNFEDEKTGEQYRGDYAENNPDYNPRANLDYGRNQYLAENHEYDGEQEYHAGIEDEPLIDPAYENYASNEEDTTDGFDQMMDNDEFAG